MQRQAMGVALHICNTFILNYCIAHNCYDADVISTSAFFFAFFSENNEIGQNDRIASQLLLSRGDISKGFILFLARRDEPVVVFHGLHHLLVANQQVAVATLHGQKLNLRRQQSHCYV